MKDYARIITKIRETNWLITPEGLSVILDIVDRRMNGNSMTDEELAILMRDSNGRRGERELQSIKGVGVLPITGPIFGKANLMTEMSGATSLETFQGDFRTMLADDMIQSILLQIDSPGGTSDLVQEVGEEIRTARDIKPIYAIADQVAGSAAYWLLSQATEAYATPSGSVGSIGVYTVHEDQSVADAQQGRKFTYISAGPFKTEGNSHEPLSQEGRQFRQERVNELYETFVDAIASGRKTSTEVVKDRFGGGRMLSPAKALEAGMIDGVVPYEKLVGHLVQQPRRVQVAIGDGRIAAGVLDGNKLTFADQSTQAWLIDANAEEYIKGVVRLESKEWEHSEPGTGSPPAPRTDEDGSDDPAIKSGSRRDPLPLPLGSPGAPSPNANSLERGESALTPEDLEELRTLLSLSATDDIVLAVRRLHEEIVPLRNSVNRVTEETRLQKEYPAMYAEHMEMRARNRQSAADSFCAKVSRIHTASGDKMIPSATGFSALALETISEKHMKFASGEGTLTDFEEAISTIMVGGIVEYGERGSALTKGDIDVVIDTATPQGLYNARMEFASRVKEIEKEDNLEYMAAVAEAAKRHPDLATAWQQTLPA